MKISFALLWMVWSLSGNSFAQDTLFYPSLPAGIKAPSFSGVDEGGKSVSLADVKARYLLIYYYEVHCHLCEVMTPQLKSLYDSYHKLGLEVLAVAATPDKRDWLDYIREHGLDWKNVFVEGENLERLRTAYRISVSPTIYLLDRRRMLLTNRLSRIEQVEEALNKHIR